MFVYRTSVLFHDQCPVRGAVHSFNSVRVFRENKKISKEYFSDKTIGFPPKVYKIFME